MAAHHTMKTPKRLVLCFDGTDNKYSADETDSNIVKIYELMDRESQEQYHYYQPGIGTYVPNKLNNSTAGLRDKIAMLRDSGFGTYFVNHVIGGYQFLLRYYSQGDKIYIFGFSRGAYTARFLSEMIDNIGLLSMGNEEMIYFAWEAFCDYQKNRGTDKEKEKEDFMKQYKLSFCRKSDGQGDEVKVHFLGLFDCVNSVLAFSTAKTMPMPHHQEDSYPAKFVRHAVSIHERRGLFQPVLFDPEPDPQVEPPSGTTQLVERWFAGNHGDVGGGWRAHPHLEGKEPYLLSDIPLMWMIDQVREVDEAAFNSGDKNILAWRETFPQSADIDFKIIRSGNWKSVCEHAQKQIRLWDLEKNDNPKPADRIRKVQRRVHDVLKSGTDGPGPKGLKEWFRKWSKRCFWWFTEHVPVLRWHRAALGSDTPHVKHWRMTRSLNHGRPRDIPENAWKHWSVPKLRACQVKGVGALDRMTQNDERFKFEESGPSEQAI